MNIYLWVLVIFLASLGLMLAAGWYLARPGQIPLKRLADPAPLPGEVPYTGIPLPNLPVSGPSGPWLETRGFISANDCTQIERTQLAPYGPFPVDTGPLLILSEQAAANVALEREIRLRCAEAEAKIPPRWR